MTAELGPQFVDLMAYYIKSSWIVDTNILQKVISRK